MESNAFSHIAEENMQGLYRLSFSILHTRHDAQDAVQQGLLRAWERRETARPEQIRAWLTRIVINECHNIQRKRMRVVLMGEMPEMAAPEDTYEAEAELRSAIDSLPEKLRVPLLLRYMERYSETEIAQTLGVPVTTVKNRLFRARRAVRAKFDEESNPAQPARRAQTSRRAAQARRGFGCGGGARAAGGNGAGHCGTQRIFYRSNGAAVK